MWYACREQDWHLCSKCRSCDFFPQCHEDAKESQALSCIPYISHGQKQWLEDWVDRNSTDIADIEDLQPIQQLQAVLQRDANEHRRHSDNEQQKLSSALSITYDDIGTLPDAMPFGCKLHARFSQPGGELIVTGGNTCTRARDLSLSECCVHV